MSAATAAITLALTPALVASADEPKNYGPYPSNSSDSGTCGNNWADDAFDRHFIVTESTSGSLTVVERFENGSFKTPSTTPPNSNQSPGACQTSLAPTGNGGTVDAGITGTLSGYFTIPMPPLTEQTSASPYCNAITSTNQNCDTTTFINTHFSCVYGVSCPVTTFFFSYNAEDQCLLQNHWQNASADVGGNKGDIRSGHPCCQEGDGQGDFQGQQQGNFSFDGDGCKDGDQEKVESSNRGDGKDVHSTSIQTMKFDSVAHTVTITGVGLVGGVPMSFVFVALETDPTTPGWVSFAFSDGYSNAGTLLNGTVLLH